MHQQYICLIRPTAHSLTAWPVANPKVRQECCFQTELQFVKKQDRSLYKDVYQKHTMEASPAAASSADASHKRTDAGIAAASTGVPLYS